MKVFPTAHSIACWALRGSISGRKRYYHQFLEALSPSQLRAGNTAKACLLEEPLGLFIKRIPEKPMYNGINNWFWFTSSFQLCSITNGCQGINIIADEYQQLYWRQCISQIRSWGKFHKIRFRSLADNSRLDIRSNAHHWLLWLMAYSVLNVGPGGVFSSAKLLLSSTSKGRG
jgi:hypothetical protein